MMKKEREPMTVGIKTSMNLPPPKAIIHDLDGIRKSKARAAEAIIANGRMIQKEKDMQKRMKDLSVNPGPYNAEACAKGAVRCGENIAELEALNSKEEAKVEQLEHIIADLEKRLWLSERISR